MNATISRENILTKADVFADQFLGNRTRPITQGCENRSEDAGTVHYHTHHHNGGGGGWSWMPLFWPSSNTVVIQGERDGQQTAKANNMAIGVLGAMVFSGISLAVSYFIGKNIAELKHCNRNLKRVNLEKKVFPKTDEVHQLVKKERKLITRLRTKAIVSLALKISLLAGSILGAFGAGCMIFASIPATLITPLAIAGAAILGLGAVSALASGAGMLGFHGYHSFDHSNKELAREIKADVARIQSGV